MYKLAQSATYTIWGGLAIFNFFGLLFYRSYNRVKDENNSIFRSLMILVIVITGFFYLILALSTLVDEPFIIGYDIELLQYIRWMITTPILIFQIGLLENIPLSNIILLVTFDLITLSCGLMAYYSSSPVIYYPLFIAGTCSWLVIVKFLLNRTFKFYRMYITQRTINNWIFTILVIGMIVIWSIYPVVVLLAHLSVLDINQQIIATTILDVLSKGVFGIILVGAKEVEEGIESTMANLSKSITRVHPITLDPVKEDMVNVELDEKGNRRKPRRGSIYIYTPPISTNTIIDQGSTNTYSSISNVTTLLISGNEVSDLKL